MSEGIDLKACGIRISVGAWLRRLGDGDLVLGILLAVYITTPFVYVGGWVLASWLFL